MICELRNENGKVPYTFSEQNQVGKVAENIFKFWMSTMPCYSVVDVSEDRVYQKQDVDFLVHTRQGTSKVEVKGDSYTTGNIFLELYVNSLMSSSPTSASLRQNWAG
jgi:hypothetical protein